MQLNMVTPMDIGQEQQDGITMEMFDLGEVEGGKIRKGVKGGADFDDEADMSGDEGPAEHRLARPQQIIPDVESDDEDVSDDERKTRRLEESLDILYESYQQTKLERDHRQKVKLQRERRAAGYHEGLGRRRFG
jgi:AdoMet-dependent rRNA methyltransferase SPB1